MKRNCVDLHWLLSPYRGKHLRTGWSPPSSRRISSAENKAEPEAELGPWIYRLLLCLCKPRPQPAGLINLWHGLDQEQVIKTAQHEAWSLSPQSQRLLLSIPCPAGVWRGFVADPVSPSKDEKFTLFIYAAYLTYNMSAAARLLHIEN